MAAVTGTGALQTGPATLAGFGLKHYTTIAALSGPHATASGSGVRRITGTGVLNAPHALLSGAIARGYKASGALVAPRAFLEATTFVPDNTIWETDNAPWGSADFVYADNKPVMIVGNEFFQADRGLRFGDQSLNVVISRTGLTIMGRDRFGNWKSDPSSMKIVNGIWAIIRGSPGDVVKVYIGAQDSTEEPVRWEGPYDYIIGTTVYLDYTVTGRYIGVRFESQDMDPWELLSYDLDLEHVGEKG